MAESAESPLLGVVTVTYNAEAFIDEFLGCCLSQTYKNFKLLIIDNASSDKSKMIIRGYDDIRFQLMINSQNVGYSEACNQAIAYFKRLGTKQMLFLNNDTIFSELLFINLLSARESYHVDAVTPRIIYASDPSKNWYAGGKFNYWRGFQGEHLGEGRLNKSEDTTPRLTPVASGCCILFSMNVFEVVGNFDPDFFVYGEDTDLFIRMYRHHMTLLYHPGIVLAHKVSLSTGGAGSDFSLHYYHRNQIYLIRKHLSVFWIPIQLILILSKASIRYLAGFDTRRQFFLRLKGIVEGFRIKKDKQAKYEISN